MVVETVIMEVFWYKPASWGRWNRNRSGNLVQTRLTGSMNLKYMEKKLPYQQIPCLIFAEKFLIERLLYPAS